MSVAVRQGKSVLENSGVGVDLVLGRCWWTPDLKHMAVSSGRKGGFAPGGAGDLVLGGWGQRAGRELSLRSLVTGWWEGGGRAGSGILLENVGCRRNKADSSCLLELQGKSEGRLIDAYGRA